MDSEPPQLPPPEERKDLSPFKEVALWVELLLPAFLSLVVVPIAGYFDKTQGIAVVALGAAALMGLVCSFLAAIRLTDSIGLRFLIAFGLVFVNLAIAFGGCMMMFREHGM